MINKFISVCLFLFLFPCICAAESETEKRPLWEFGLFNAAARIPHYRGADEYNTYALPLPYLIYRGEIIQSDREGLRGIFFKNNHFESGISLSGNPPADDDSKAREGMPELDTLLEIGPSLKYYFTGRAYPQKHTLYAESALRAAMSLSFDSGADIAYEGLRADIHLNYISRILYQKSGILFGGKIGFDFGNSELNGYFYDVSSAYVRPGRESYASGGGYAGVSLSGWISKKLTKNLSLGFYSGLSNISGSVFEDSPLVKEKNNITVGCALSWKIWESAQTVTSSR